MHPNVSEKPYHERSAPCLIRSHLFLEHIRKWHYNGGITFLGNNGYM